MCQNVSLPSCSTSPETNDGKKGSSSVSGWLDFNRKTMKRSSNKSRPLVLIWKNGFCFVRKQHLICQYTYDNATNETPSSPAATANLATTTEWPTDRPTLGISGAVAPRSSYTFYGQGGRRPPVIHARCMIRIHWGFRRSSPPVVLHVLWSGTWEASPPPNSCIFYDHTTLEISGEAPPVIHAGLRAVGPRNSCMFCDQNTLLVLLLSKYAHAVWSEP